MLEENIRINLYRLELGKAFLAMTPKAQETKGGRMSWNSPKLKPSKDNIKTVKKTTYKTGENICN